MLLEELLLLAGLRRRLRRGGRLCLELRLRGVPFGGLCRQRRAIVRQPLQRLVIVRGRGGDAFVNRRQ